MVIYIQIGQDMRILNLLILTIISSFFLFSPFALAFAQTKQTPSPTPQAIEVPYENVNPNGGFSYVQKRLGEKIKLLFLSFSSNSKEEFYKELVETRLAELKYVIENKDMSNFEKATIRYSSTVGDWTEFILNKQLTAKKKQAVEVLNGHLPVVEQMMNRYDGTTAEWRFVKQDADYLRIYIKMLQN